MFYSTKNFIKTKLYNLDEEISLYDKNSPPPKKNIRKKNS